MHHAFFQAFRLRKKNISIRDRYRAETTQGGIGVIGPLESNTDEIPDAASCSDQLLRGPPIHARSNRQVAFPTRN